MASSKNFCTSLTSLEVSQFNTPFTFSFSILILSSLITTPKNSTFLTFYLYFSSFTYKLFSASLFTISFTILSCPSFSSISTITSSIKLATSPVLTKSYRISFIIIWNIARELVSPKNITVSLNWPWCQISCLLSTPQPLFLPPTLLLMPIQICCPLAPLFDTS